MLSATTSKKISGERGFEQFQQGGNKAHGNDKNMTGSRDCVSL